MRAPLDVVFLGCCIVLTADVLGPEIFGNGKTKDYPLWFWAGQQVLHGRDLYPSDPKAYFDFIYPPLSAILRACVDAESPFHPPQEEAFHASPRAHI